MAQNAWTVDSILQPLCNKYRDYLEHLPMHERDMRHSADIAWCLAYSCEDFTKLPWYWRQVVGTLLYGLRGHRVGTIGKSRSPEVDEFCNTFLQWLWDKHSRQTIAMCTIAPWYLSCTTFQQCYDQLWTMWGELNG